MCLSFVYLGSRFFLAAISRSTAVCDAVMPSDDRSDDVQFSIFPLLIFRFFGSTGFLMSLWYV